MVERSNLSDQIESERMRTRDRFSAKLHLFLLFRTSHLWNKAFSDKRSQMSTDDMPSAKQVDGGGGENPFQGLQYSNTKSEKLKTQITLTSSNDQISVSWPINKPYSSCGTEKQTSPLFEWLKLVHYLNVPVFKCHLN